MPTRPCILVIDADAASRDQLVTLLQAAGWLAISAAAGAAGLERLRDTPPDALLLDLDLPDTDGKTVIAEARGFFERPVIVVSGRADVRETVAALDLGADDYVHKPFDPDELLARLRTAMRNKAALGGAPPTVRAGGIEIDLRRRIVRRGGAEVRLSSREYSLLAELARAAGKVLTHRQLLIAVWGPNRLNHVEYLRVFIQQLRHKLEPDPARPRLILTETGVGYRLTAVD